MVKSKLNSVGHPQALFPPLCLRKETSNALQARYLEGHWNSGLQYLIFIYLAFQENFQPGSALHVIPITILINRHLEQGMPESADRKCKQRQSLVSYQELLSALPRASLERRMQAGRVMAISPNSWCCSAGATGSQGEAQLICCALCLLWEEAQCLG